MSENEPARPSSQVAFHSPVSAFVVLTKAKLRFGQVERPAWWAVWALVVALPLSFWFVPLAAPIVALAISLPLWLLLRATEQHRSVCEQVAVLMATDLAQVVAAAQQNGAVLQDSTDAPTQVQT